MDKFAVCMLDLLTVLLLSLIALVTHQKTVPKESGLFDEGFVLIEFQCEGVQSLEIGTEEHFLVNSTGMLASRVERLEASNASVGTAKDSPVSAFIQCNESGVVGGDLFLVSKFTDPSQFELNFRPASKGKVSVQIYDLEGAEETHTFHFDGPTKVVIRTRRVGAELETEVNKQGQGK